MPEEVEVIQKVIFTTTWKNGSKPDYVFLPSGRKVMVTYMKNGKIMFDDGNYGNFFWELDNKETGEKRIRVEMER